VREDWTWGFVEFAQAGFQTHVDRFHRTGTIGVAENAGNFRITGSSLKLGHLLQGGVSLPAFDRSGAQWNQPEGTSGSQLA
jgi:hypothetical protein